MDALRARAEDPTLWQNVEVARGLTPPPKPLPDGSGRYRDPITMEGDSWMSYHKRQIR